MDEVMKQNLKEKGEFQNVYTMFLLFEVEGQRVKAEDIKEEVERRLGQVDLVADVKDSLTSFALKEHLVTYKDNQRVPAQLLMAEFAPFQANKIGQFERSQFWECRDGNEILESCKYQLMISDFVAAGLPYKERGLVLGKWLETALILYPDCKAVWNPACGKLLTRESILNNPYSNEDIFLHIGINIRFFNIQGSNDMLIDTLGLYAIGLPDVQIHFNNLNPNHIVNHTFNIAHYLYMENVPIQDGETVAGIFENGEMNPDANWRCQFEDALIQPARVVMDVCAGEYAARDRTENIKE